MLLIAYPFSLRFLDITCYLLLLLFLSLFVLLIFAFLFYLSLLIFPMLFIESAFLVSPSYYRLYYVSGHHSLMPLILCVILFYFLCFFRTSCFWISLLLFSRLIFSWLFLLSFFLTLHLICSFIASLFFTSGPLFFFFFLLCLFLMFRASLLSLYWLFALWSYLIQIYSDYFLLLLSLLSSHHPYYV